MHKLCFCCCCCCVCFFYTSLSNTVKVLWEKTVYTSLLNEIRKNSVDQETLACSNSFVLLQSIRTSKRTYTAQFDLMKDVRVRIYTLLSGTCTNDTMIKSTDYTEVIQKSPSTGQPSKAYKICDYRKGVLVRS